MGAASVARRIAGIVATAALAGYPLVVWYGLGHWSARTLALALLALLLPLTLWRLRVCVPERVRGLGAVPLVTLCALGAASLLDARGYVLVVPVAINAALFVGFASTLRRGAVPMIERFARLQESTLSSRQRAWCRLWTLIWCAFFVLNGGIALALVLIGSLAAWTLYNGLVAYVLMGVLFVTEIGLRRRLGVQADPVIGDVS